MKLYLYVLMVLLLMSISSAFLGVYKQGDCVQIKTILNVTWVNISTISYPNSTIIVSNDAMTKTGQTFTYSFCSTSELGNYIYDYYTDAGDVYVNDFTITTTGSDKGNTRPLFLLLGGFIVLGIALYSKNEFFGYLSGSMFIISGVYMMIYGLGSFLDMYTKAIAYTSLGLGIILTLVSAYEHVWGESGEAED